MPQNPQARSGNRHRSPSLFRETWKVNLAGPGFANGKFTTNLTLHAVGQISISVMSLFDRDFVFSE